MQHRLPKVVNVPAWPEAKGQIVQPRRGVQEDNLLSTPRIKAAENADPKKTQAASKPPGAEHAQHESPSTLDQPLTPVRPLAVEEGIAMEDASFLYDHAGPDEDPDLTQHDVDNLVEGFEDVPVDSVDVKDAADLCAPDDENASMDVEHGSTDMATMVDCLQTLGVAPELANRYAAASVWQHKAKPTTCYEAYNTGNIVKIASGNLRNLNNKGLGALDIRTCRPDGKAWDFTKRSHSKLAHRLIKEQNPDWRIGSPPCTAFCTWNTRINSCRMEPERREKQLQDGRANLRFVISLYGLQLSRNKHFLHDHPAGAASWSEPAMVQRLSHENVGVVKSDQCMYGLFTPSKDGAWMLARKPTQWASSSPQMPTRLSKRCSHEHGHQRLDGGRASDAELYPPALISDILRGIRATYDAQHHSSQHEGNHPDGVAPVSAHSGRCAPYPVKRKTHSLLMDYDPTWSRLLADRDLVAAVQGTCVPLPICGWPQRTCALELQEHVL